MKRTYLTLFLCLTLKSAVAGKEALMAAYGSHQVAAAAMPQHINMSQGGKGEMPQPLKGFLTKEAVSPKEQHIKAHDLEGLTLSSTEITERPYAGAIMQAQERRPAWKEDFTQRGDLKAANNIVKDPGKLFKNKYKDCHEVEEGGKTDYQLKTCFESRSLKSQSCVERPWFDIDVRERMADKIAPVTFHVNNKYGATLANKKPFLENPQPYVFDFEQGTFSSPFFVVSGNVPKLPDHVTEIELVSPLADASLYLLANGYNMQAPHALQKVGKKKISMISHLYDRGVFLKKNPFAMAWLVVDKTYGWDSTDGGYKSDPYEPQVNLSGSFKVRYKEKQIERHFKKHHHHDLRNCKSVEELVEQGVCAYTSRTCIEGEETRLLEGKIPHHEPCWAWKREYTCLGDIGDTCGSLKKDPLCERWGMTCVEEKGDFCLKYKVTYRCQKDKQIKHRSKRLICGDTPFCLSGECHDMSYEGNQDMNEVLGKLSILRELQGHGDPITVFKGKGHRCTIDAAGFRDCCGLKGGWGTGVGFQKCNAEEEALSKQRPKGLCHQVDAWCKTKVLGVCLTKARSYCCFPSKIVKIISVAAHQQLGLSWGQKEHPNCRGLTQDELYHLDFNKIDFSEVLNEMQSRAKVEDTSHIDHRIKHHFKDFEPKIKSLKAPKEIPTTGGRAAIQQRKEESHTTPQVVHATKEGVSPSSKDPRYWEMAA